LPAGVHAASWPDVVERFGGSARGARLLALLHEALPHLAQAGCHTLFLPAVS
jgi:hypothetical protein